MSLSRREFLASTAAGAGSGLARPGGSGQIKAPPLDIRPGPAEKLDLSPASWLWYPSGRCLANTFVLFRRIVELPAGVRVARGWITADSRYLLTVNGERVQWGPAPADPRWPDVDPIDLASCLRPGRNVIAATVLYYGSGDGTSPIGKPGFIFKLEIENADLSRTLVTSDAQWQCSLAKAWRPGHYRRWYLRALQEEFDARLYPDGWDRPEFSTGPDWLPAMALGCPADKPSVCSDYSDYSMDTRGDPAVCFLRPRQIPPLLEKEVTAARLADSFRLRWSRSPEEYFDCRTPGAFQIAGEGGTSKDGESWLVRPDEGKSAVLTFEFAEQVVGWPHFTIDAPAGTAIELLVQESHATDGPRWLDTHHYSWTRFICREGVNRFETFDYESLRWMQLHIREFSRPVRVSAVGVRRRLYPWPSRPDIQTSDPELNRLLGACVNTLDNSAQEHIVDGMGRERQQYSGDCGHQIHAIYVGFGEQRLPARYLRTFSEGLTLQGFFLDCWPAFDRLARVMERQVGLTNWGPLLDHGIGFNFDCWHHYLYTGDLAALRDPYPRLARFLEYLSRLPRRDGLLPVENLGTPAVWMDHQAYLEQRHKQCAFNLYASAMMRRAFAPLARALGDEVNAYEAEVLGASLLDAAIVEFWDPEMGVFVANRPWSRSEGRVRMCDRSIANSILFDQCPEGRIQPGARVLAECPAEMGLSYPANAGWRLWALAEAGRADVILSDLRKRWTALPSVLQNNSIQEDWVARPDSGSQWSHCAVVPLYVAYMSLAGIMPVEPGFKRCEIRPQPGDLRTLRLTARTVRGPIGFAAEGDPPRRRYAISIPESMAASAVFPASATVSLPRDRAAAPRGLARYTLTPGKAAEFEVVEP